jgi:hypothetical protein
VPILKACGDYCLAAAEIGVCAGSLKLLNPTGNGIPVPVILLTSNGKGDAFF